MFAIPFLDIPPLSGAAGSKQYEVDVLITAPGTTEEEISERREGGGKVIVA